MRASEDPILGLMLVAPPAQLLSLLLRIINRKNTSARPPTEPSPDGQGPEISIQPLSTKTVEGLTSLLNRASLSQILVLCDIETLQELAAFEGPDVEGYAELLSGVFRVATEETPGQFTAAERHTSDGTNLGQLLSPRELEVLEQLVLGSSNNQIAEVLSITPNTVYTHVRHIQAKLRTSNRTQTALAARTMLHQS